METLASVTGIPMTDQILMSDKVRLDPAKSLSAYKLPVRFCFCRFVCEMKGLLEYQSACRITLLCVESCIVVPHECERVQ